MVVDKSFFMNLALEEAWRYQGLTYPNPAVGCVVVGSNFELLAIEAHHQAGKPHAEVMALQSAYFKLTQDKNILKLQKSSDIHEYLILNHNNRFEGVSLYSTLEPCSHIGKTPSCATLISKLNIKKVFVGSLDTNKIASNGNEILSLNGVDIKSGVLKDECDKLLYPFQKFNSDRFVFFKWAQRLNGSSDDGIVSSTNSRINVHQMRDVCDLLVVGGNTVRVDRPTLDARLVGGKAPDILIYSREKEFDKTIPLFKVEGRKVFIENNLNRLESYKNIMIEGGLNMFKLTKDVVDYHLCYVAPTFGGSNYFQNVKERFEILNLKKVDKDIIIWMKREENAK